MPEEQTEEQTEERTARSGRLRNEVLLVAVLFAIEVSGAAVMGRKGDEPDLTLVGVLYLVGQTAPLVWRRRAPVTVALVTGVFAAAYGIAELPDTIAPLGALVALATVVELRPRRTAVLVGLLALGTALPVTAAAGDSDAQDYWFGAVVLILAWVVGDLLRARHEHLLELEHRAARLAADRQRELADARAAERTRLARELHDVVAHHVSMMVVQAEAGAATLGEGSNSSAFDGIARTGREALTELRRLLTILRRPDQPASMAPQPGVEQIAALVDQVRAAGLEVEYRAEGTPLPLPPGVDLSAYRVVQEGLTNVLKHAGRAHATVTVRYRADCVELAVVDDGAGPRPGNGGPGFGLVGLRERVALFGGRLDAGPGDHGGYALDVRLPINQ